MNNINFDGFDGYDPDYEILIELNDRFINFNEKEINKIIYFDGWCDYEEDGGLLIFKNKENKLFVQHYGYCVMVENHDEQWTPSIISQKDANSLIIEMTNTIKEVQKPMF